MRRLGLLSLAATTALMASGYKIPEQSQKGVALSSAYVANANGADASYYNPANMAFEKGNGAFEMDLSYIQLSSVKFEGNVNKAAIGVNDSSGGDSKKESFLHPTFYYVSPEVNNLRFGVALTSPVGLSKRWDNQPARISAEEFTLMTVEINPTAAYKINDKVAVAVGIRAIYSDGVVKSLAPAPSDLTRNLTGNGLDFGYNLAVTYKPLEALSLAATYRSKIDLNLKGNATLSGAGGIYSGPASVSVPAPATLSLAGAYTFTENTTVELVFDRTYWSTYRQLDFEYQGNRSLMTPGLISAFDTSVAKNWSDANSYRLGITHKYDSAWTAMLGMVYYETPIPDSDVGFDLPDSNGMAYSIGTRYKYSKQIELGASFLYADRESRTVSTPANTSGITGTFSNSNVYFLSLGIEYKF